MGVHVARTKGAARPSEAPVATDNDRGGGTTGGIAEALAEILGTGDRIGIEAYDGSRAGPAEATATLVVARPSALARIASAPNDLGLGRAFVAGDLDVRGDLFAALAWGRELQPRLRPATLARLVRLAGRDALHWPRPPLEEARLSGRPHSRRRDAAAVTYHYDVSNRFYELLLGPSMTYSCAVWPGASSGTLEQAQTTKHDLVCRKLGLRPGMRVLDVGCGWGSTAIHAARHFGVEVVGITLSSAQAELASARVRDAGLGDLVQIRLQDYRDVADGPFDAVCSIGMVEHVGMARLPEYSARLAGLLRPGGRLLNHGIARAPEGHSRDRDVRARWRGKRTFIDRYVFPDGELHEVGRVVSTIQGAGLEVRNVENLREHYARTTRAWVANLDAAWDEAVAEVGAARARVWRLYLAGAAVNFEAGGIQIHQVLAVRPDRGRSGMPWRPDWEPTG